MKRRALDDLDPRLPLELTLLVARRLAESWDAALSRRRRLAAREELPLLGWAQSLLPHYIRRGYSRMHQWLGPELDTLGRRRGARLNVLAPRGGAKSTLVTLAYVLREAVEETEPYIWIVSDTKPQAHGHLDHIKLELADNRALAERYPGATGPGPVWRAGAIRLRNGVAIEAFGAGQSLRGRRRRETRPTLVVCDDLQNDRDVASPAEREAIGRWFQGALLKAGTKETNVIHLATALHRDALAMALTRTPGWTSRVFQAIESWPARMDLWAAWETIFSDLALSDAPAAAAEFYAAHRAEMDAGANLLWPEEEDLLTLMKLRAEGGHAAFDREKQNVPTGPESCEWPEEYFEGPLWFAEWPAELAVRTMALDPSKGADARRGDYSALVLLGLDAAGLCYVEADLARRPTPVIVTDGVAHFRRFHPDAFGVEANQFQELLAGEFEQEFRRQGALGARPWLLTNHAPKTVRIRRLGPLLAQRRLRFKQGSPGTTLLVEQLREFPTGAHDDGPDALEMALRLASALLDGAAADDGLGARLELGT